jgi:hypothetical protein
MKEEIRLLLPTEKAVGLCLPPGPKNVAARGGPRLLLDGLQRVVQGHLLANQAFDGKQFDDLVLLPNGKLAMRRPHLQQDRTPSQSPGRCKTLSGQRSGSHLGPPDADTSSDPG